MAADSGAKFSGGSKLRAHLARLGANVSSGTAVRVGFLEDKDYPATKKGPGLKVAQVAFWNEFGTINAPARPFFRNMIATESPSWGKKLANALKAGKFNALYALQQLGLDIAGALGTSINEWPADNAPRTVARKGFNKGLIETGDMSRAPDFEVVTAP